jgi:uncharacterized protein (TIGR02001 family)
MLARSCAALLLVLGCAGFARGDDRLGGSIGATSDYVLRGISQSDSGPAVQGDLHYFHPSGWFGGLWASTVQLGRGRRDAMEYNGYLGYSWQATNDWSTRLTAVHYMYYGNAIVRELDYDEVLWSVNYRDNLAFTVAWSWNAARYSQLGFAEDKQAVSYEAAYAQPLPQSLTVRGGLGYYDLQDLLGTGYWFWHGGLGYESGVWRAELGYIGTDRQAQRLFASDLGGHRWSANLQWRF